ncbi:MAG: NAD(P)/FAD-dependent oxidoreductase [Gemmatimonadota bacterium]
MELGPNGCIVVGAGPAGLATAQQLGERGIPHIVLERGADIAHCWRNAYDSLRLHTGKHLSALPGMRFPGTTPLFPSRDDFVDYLMRYARRFNLSVQTNRRVNRITRDQSWIVETDRGVLRAPNLVCATGIMSNPIVPYLTGRELFRGRIIHSVEYRRPDPFEGQRVLVVGVGNSGGEIASELAAHGVDVSIAVRSGANVVPLTIAGLPVQYLSALVRKLPRTAQEWVVERIRRRSDARRPPVLPRPAHSPLDSIPLIGFSLVDAIAAGSVVVRSGLAGFTEEGVRYTDLGRERFDVVILATGFRAALSPLGSLVSTDARGFALRRDRVRSAQHDSLWFVGHNYDSTGGLRNINTDSRLVSRQIAA